MVYKLTTGWTVYRCGWIAKAIHTIFDYLDHNSKNDQQVGRAYSDWQINDNSDFTDQSGLSPSLLSPHGVVERLYKYWDPNLEYDHYDKATQFSRILFCK